MIGIGGNKEAGKDTLAQFLVDEYGFVKFSFADTLKNIAMSLLHLSKYHCYDTKGKEETLDFIIEFNENTLTKIYEWVANYIPMYHKLDIDKCINTFLLSHPDLCVDTPRKALQILGTEVLRDQVDPHFHIRCMDWRIDSFDVPKDKVVIPDARFENERTYVRYNNGVLVLVEEVNAASIERDAHRSESNLGSHSDYDIVVYNDKREGTDWFKKKVMDINLPDMQLY